MSKKDQIPRAVAPADVFLASNDDSSYITGTAASHGRRDYRRIAVLAGTRTRRKDRMSQANGVENDAMSAAPPAAPPDAIYRRIVESIGDYAIFMLDGGASSDLDGQRGSDPGIPRVRDHRASTSRASTPGAIRAAGRTKTSSGAPPGPLRGRGLARAQGRLALLGQRRHYRRAR